MHLGEETKDKFTSQLKEILDGCEAEFSPTMNDLIKIHNLSENLPYNGFTDKKKLNQLKLLIWKYYRIYKLKEFILQFHKRIAVERNTVDKNSFKTVEMINAVFCWEITNSGNNNDKKYNQKYYTDRVLQNKIKKDYVTGDKSISDRSILLRAILGQELVAYEQNEEEIFLEPEIRTNNGIANKAWNDFIIKKYNDRWNDIYGKNEEISLKEILIRNQKDLSFGQNFIHSYAVTSGGKIQLDHALPRFFVKKIIEELCVILKSMTNQKCQIELIDQQINFLIPLMFGCVVTQQENSKLNQISEELAERYFKMLNKSSQNNLFSEFNQSEENFCVLYKHTDKGKKARKYIASELFFQYWNDIDWSDDNSKKNNRSNILNMLFLNYQCSQLDDSPNEDGSKNIRLQVVGSEGLHTVEEFSVEEENLDGEIKDLKILFNS